MNDILHAFATAGDGFPCAAMEQALADWEAAAPPLLAALADYAEGRDRSAAAASAAFHIIYLAAQARERRAFPLLCRLAQDQDALDAAIGDAAIEDLPGLIAGCFDGDLDRLLALALDARAEEMIRHAAIEALTLLFATRALPMAQAESVLRDLHDRLLRQDKVADWVWVGWQQAVALLGLAGLRAEAMALFRAGRIDRSIMSAKDFEADLKDGTAPGVDRLELLEEQGVTPIGDVVAMFAEWHRIRVDEAAKQAARAARPALAPTTVVNLHRDVGRNDPCPCGSGKKFKKCCLPA